MRSGIYPGKKRRNQKGNIPELPVVLLVLFIFLFFPMLNLVTATIRAYFLRSAVLDAAHNAAKACTYGTHLPATPDDAECDSAVERATQTLTGFTNSFSGVSVQSSRVYVVRQPLSGGAPITYPPGPVPQADIKPEENQYYIEVAIQGQAQPLITVPMFSNVPGLGGPMPLNATGRETFEQVEGLSQ